MFQGAFCLVKLHCRGEKRGWEVHNWTAEGRCTYLRSFRGHCRRGLWAFRFGGGRRKRHWSGYERQGGKPRPVQTSVPWHAFEHHTEIGENQRVCGHHIHPAEAHFVAWTSAKIIGTPIKHWPEWHRIGIHPSVRRPPSISLAR